MTRLPHFALFSKLLLVVAAGLASLAIFSACTPETAAEIKTYTGINAIRQQHGLPPLKVDAGLVVVAKHRSRDMAAKGYFSHTPPDGCNFACLLTHYGIPRAYAGENIAWNTRDWAGTADMAVEMWRNSPPHLENILSCRYERFGSGVVRATDGKIYLTMIFEGNGRC